MIERKTDTKFYCFHCGDECPDDIIHIDEKIFCCNGCKTVYEILNGSNLCNYYSIDQNPGITRKHHIKRNYDFLNDADLKLKLIDYTDGKRTQITFDIPQMHCSSCIWILENLYKLNAGIISSKVNFLQKKIFISYSEETTSLKKIVELLDSIGYEPQLNLDNHKEENIKSLYKNLYYKIGIAGFCFGNIMLLSFPEYLSIDVTGHDELKKIFAYLNIILALPVFFYSASGYFISAWKGLKKKFVNIDVPLALGIAVLFFRSIIDIVFMHGAGYLDSLAGLVFFLLTGKLFQNKTYETLNFERNYKSYFPIAVTIQNGKNETTIPVEKLKIGDRLIIRNNELVPADSILIKGNAHIDYGFVTGESMPINRVNGEMIYAGGKQIGSAIEVETIKEVSQSYLTQLWNNKAFRKEQEHEQESRITSFANTVSKYFTAIVLLLAVIAALIWYNNMTLAFNAFTAVLIVACPCALALSTPFALGNTLRIFGRNKFYLKNTFIIEKLAAINSIVFDKTGTITENNSSSVVFTGDELNESEKVLVKSAVRNSTHPLSKAVFNFINSKITKNIDLYDEQTGKGIYAVIDGNEIKLGSKIFVNRAPKQFDDEYSTKVFLSINGAAKGYFNITNKYRNGLSETISELEHNYELALLSGDNEGEKEKLRNFFGADNELHFRQSPHNKLDFILQLQKNGKKVLMIGDGLNDAGALKQSDVGISISDNTNNFSPACDGILDSQSFSLLKDFIKFSTLSMRIIFSSFILSLVYNLIGLGFAFQGTLSPLIAAILMPLSSISAVVFTTVLTNVLAKRQGLI
ncbi:MAG: heavy metal translocating P-type ATPase metal-binding domain-containing protein [Ignavibacteriales bacterium]|nr:heavy metal translocating P-type ATPase metal-binding domain-containing protein [Ignavibacteriales bacterium]